MAVYLSLDFCRGTEFLAGDSDKKVEDMPVFKMLTFGRCPAEAQRHRRMMKVDRLGQIATICAWPSRGPKRPFAIQAWVGPKILGQVRGDGPHCRLPFSGMPG